MRRIILLVFILHTSLFTLHAQTMSDVFTSMPDSLLSLLTAKNRHDMVDFYQNSMEAKVRNRLNDYARLDTLTDTYLRLSLSHVSQLEMKLLQTTDSVPLICLVRTVGAPARDSGVEFYNADWQRLQWLQLPVPKTKDYFAEAPDSVAHDLDLAQRSLDDLRLVEVTVVADAPVFTLRLSTDEMEREEKRLARRYVRDVKYRWTGQDFEEIVRE